MTSVTEGSASKWRWSLLREGVCVCVSARVSTCVCVHMGACICVYVRISCLPVCVCHVSKRYPCQGIGSEDRKQWLEVMEGKEPVYTNIKVLGQWLLSVMAFHVVG